MEPIGQLRVLRVEPYTVRVDCWVCPVAIVFGDVSIVFGIVEHAMACRLIAWVEPIDCVGPRC